MSRSVVGIASLVLSACSGLVPLGDGSQFLDSDTGRVDSEDTEDTFSLPMDTQESGLGSGDTDDTSGGGDTSDTSDTSGGGDTSDTSDTSDTGGGGGAPTAANGTMLIVEVYEGDSNDRYVALFNASQQSVSLTGWNLIRYSNGAGSGGGVPTTLSGTVASGEHYVIVNNTASGWFSSTYGQSAEQTSGNITHNGDDAYELRDLNGGLVDLYGEVGVDGTGEPWEGEDGVWTRNAGVVQGKTVWTASEWSWSDDLNGGTPYVR